MSMRLLSRVMWREWLFAGLWSYLLIVTLPMRIPSSSSWHILKYIFVFVSFFLVLRFVTHWYLRYRPADRNQLKPHFRTTLFLVSFILCTASWSFYLYLFYPGLISWDFYIQWHQMAGKIPYSDWHSVFNTLMVWMVTRLWYSPAAVALAQLVCMAFFVGITARKLERTGVSMWAVLFLVLFYALFPLFGFYSVSLWKDTLYSIAFLWLTIMLLEIVITEGAALTKIRFMAALSLSLLSVALLRHNGVVPAFGAAVVLLVWYKRQFKRIAIVIGIVGVLIGLYKGPLFSWLDVDKKDNIILKALLPMQHIGAVLANNGKLTAAEEDFLSKVISIPYWKEAYNPRSCMALLFGKDSNGRYYLDSTSRGFLREGNHYYKLLKIWAGLITRYPTVILQHHWLGSELVWRITADYRVFVIPDEDLVADDLYTGYTKSPSLRQRSGPFAQFLLDLINNLSLGWLLHRAALYWWVSLFCIILFFFRTKEAAIFVVSMPVLLHVVTVVAFPFVQNPRYMFPLMITAPLWIVLFFAPGLAGFDRCRTNRKTNHQ